VKALFEDLAEELVTQGTILIDLERLEERLATSLLHASLFP
jgi:hypothetical protein